MLKQRDAEYYISEVPPNMGINQDTLFVKILFNVKILD